MAAEHADTPGPATAAAATGPADGAAGTAAGTAAARERLAREQAGLLAALVAGAPAPEGFDRERLAVQSRALIGKRADVVAKVAPELPEIMGQSAFRAAFASYAQARPMTGGHRRDALDFAAHVLDEDLAGGRRARRRLRTWWLERSGPEPLPDGRLARTLRVMRSR